jgi:hypothetical protein
MDLSPHVHFLATPVYSLLNWVTSTVQIQQILLRKMSWFNGLKN